VNDHATCAAMLVGSAVAFIAGVMLAAHLEEWLCR